jgi:hypothetical protein
MAKNFFMSFNKLHNFCNLKYKVSFMISGVNLYSGTSNNNPSFCAVHPARMFVRTEGGEFQEVTSRITVDRLRRQVSKMLNRRYNQSAKNAGHCSSKPSPEKPEAKQIREWLEEKFRTFDKDYDCHNEVRTFARTNSNGETKAYIMSGDSVQIAENAAQPIGTAWREANDRAEVVSDNLNISYEKAKDYLRGEREENVFRAKFSYFNKVYDTIREILGRNELKNSHLDLFFDMTLKGKNLTYKLVDAKFNGN